MWLYIPPGYSPSAPEPEDSTSALPWQTHALSRFVTWNGKPSPSRTWLRRLRTAPWTTLLYGMISVPSTGERGAAKWIASLGESPARTSPQQAGGLGPRESAICGRPQPISSEQSGQPSSFWKTFRESFGITSTPLGQSFEAWDTALRRDYSRRQELLHRMIASDSSSWRTPSAVDGEGGILSDLEGVEKMIHYRLRDHAVHWPTHVTTPGAYTYGRGNHDTPHDKLDGAARNWPTATAGAGSQANSNMVDKTRTTLELATSNWLTPIASEGEQETTHYARGNLKLNGQARCFPTPTARDYKDWDGPGKQRPSRDYQVYSRLVLMLSKHGHQCSKKCRRLNPLFVSWLMGWPITWTLQPLGPVDYESLAMELSLWLEQSHFALSLLAP